MLLAENLSRFIGSNIYVVCARYAYRGVLSEVTDDGQAMVLSNVAAVQQSGSAQGEAPISEDPIGGSMVIMTGAIESISQPNFVNAPITPTPRQAR
jgi:hypothetical protein